MRSDTHETDDLLDAICDAYDNGIYPANFLATYDIMECLGEHLGCDTFLVRDTDGNAHVAKCYDLDVWETSPTRNVLAGLDHPALPRPVATYENERTTVLVRTYIEGISLDRYARAQEPDEQEIVRICVELCDVLAYLHGQPLPIIHRDIKPQNVIVRPNGSVALIDFDIARTFQAGHETDTVFFGTRTYAAPEQYGFAQTDARTDIYSLGVLLRYLLTGSPYLVSANGDKVCS